MGSEGMSVIIRTPHLLTWDSPTMLLFIILHCLLVDLVKGVPMQPGCCETKDVGGVGYTLVGQMDTRAYQCLNDCIYVKDEDPDVKFCFAAGDLEVECTGDESQPSGLPLATEKSPMDTTKAPAGSEVQKWLPWFLGMEPMELCVEIGTEVIFNKTGHNVVQMATQADYDGCTGFLGENPTVGNNIDPFPWQAEMDGVYYFACGVGTHCSAGGMKAKITVAPSCAKNVTVPWSWGMEPQVLCVETGTTVIIEKTGSSHNVNMLATQSDYDDCTGFTDTAGNSVNPFIFQADIKGTYYFACGVGTHCKSGNMKAMITVADSC